MKSLVLLAVLGITPLGMTPVAAAQPWLTDYGQALKEAKESQKPLLIVIDPPSQGTRAQQISHSSESDAQSLSSYVLCRVDGGTQYGQAVAKAFHAESLPHTAIIDKRGERILFTRAGRFSTEEWDRALTTYKSGVRPVSYQPAGAAAFQAAGCST